MKYRITYDPAKRKRTLSERGIDFEDAELVFAGRRIDLLDTRFDYGETRFLTVGYLHGRMTIVVWTPRENNRHVIPMRKANEREKVKYAQRLNEN